MKQQAQRQQTVPRALGHLRVALEDAYARASRQVGIPPAYAELLCAAIAPVPVGRLANDLRCDRTNITHLVDRAAEQGWVERLSDERDRRRSLITLTPTGERLARRFILTLETQLADLLAGWDERRQGRAITDITAIADALDRGGHADRPAAPSSASDPGRVCAGPLGASGQSPRT